MDDNIQNLAAVVATKGMMTKDDGRGQRLAELGEGGILDSMKVQEEEKS
jgi:hypothetical protein